MKWKRSAVVLFVWLSIVSGLQGLQARPVGMLMAVPQTNSHNVSLSWTASISNPVGYNVYAGATSGGPYAKKNSSLIAGLTYIDSAVSPGQTLYYVATAVTASGAESVYSNEVVATIPAVVTIAISPTTTSLPSGGTQQFAATVSGSPNVSVTWTTTIGTVSSGGLFTAPATIGTGTVTATAAADPTKSASANVAIMAQNINFGTTSISSGVDTADSNSVLGFKISAPANQSGNLASCSVYVKSPVAAAPNNQYQLALYSSVSNKPSVLLSRSASTTLTSNSWNTVTMPFAAIVGGTSYFVSYNTNGTAATQNNVATTTGSVSGQFTWINSEPFGTWPATFAPIGGSSSTAASIYCTYVVGVPPPPISVSILPTTVSIFTNGTAQFTATVTNDSANAGVKWSINAPNGVFTAGTTATTATVTATSISDPTKTASATVTITLPPLSIICPTAAAGVSGLSPGDAYVITVTSLGRTASCNGTK